MNREYIVNQLEKHIGHNLKVVHYGHEYESRNTALECKDCQEIIFDFPQ